MKWTLQDALLYVRGRQADAFRHGYNLSLGGGVLNNGESEHDLDIVAVPAKGSESTAKETFYEFLHWMKSVNGPSLLEAEHDKASGRLWNSTTRRFLFDYGDGRKVEWFVVYDCNAVTILGDHSDRSWRPQETWIGGEGGDV